MPKPRHSQGASVHNIRTLQAMRDEYRDLIRVITDHRLVKADVSRVEITSTVFEFTPPDQDSVTIHYRMSTNLTEIRGRIFIDASYEGDLMAYTGVSYRVGKESRDEYDESLAGVVIGQKFPGVDPYKEKGNPESGLLSCI